MKHRGNVLDPPGNALGLESKGCRQPVKLKDDWLAVIGKELMANVFCEPSQHISKSKGLESRRLVSVPPPGSP